MMEFIMDNYIWIMIILGVALLACIGYVVDKKEKKVKSKKIEELSNETNVVVPTVEQVPNKLEEVVEPIEEIVQPVEEVMETPVEQPIVEEIIPTEEVSESVVQSNEEMIQEPQIEEIQVEEMDTQEEEKTLEVEETVNQTEEVVEPIFEGIESFEPIKEENLENIESIQEPVEELIPVEQPRSELTDGSEELILDGDPTIDQDFQSLLEDEEMEELEVELPPIEETKKEDFKSIDDDDEDLWTF